MPDYSATPLVTKLGIREGFRLALVNAPENFLDLLVPIPDGLTILSTPRRPLDAAILFTRDRHELAERFAKLAAALKPSGMLWVAWPKKSSGVPTDLTFDVVQRIGLDAGLVDTKICAVDATWSGLKFVYRLKDR